MKVEEIRMAGTGDIAEIQKVIDSVWPKSGISDDRIAGILGDTTHATMVYVSEGAIAGFVAGYLINKSLSGK